MTAQRDGGQVHPGGPSLGPFHELIQVRFAELDAGHGEQQLRGLVRGEAQFPGPYLGHLPGRPQPGQRQRRVGPGDDHELRGRRQVEQQEHDLLVAASVPDHVVVVEHQDHRCRDRGQFVGQHGQHRLRELRGLRPQFIQDRLAVDLRAGPGQRADHIPPQPAWVAVAAVERDPGEGPGLRRAGPPLRDEGGLPEPGRSIHQHQLRGGLCQFVDECRPLHPLGPDTRRIELGLDRRIQPSQSRGHRSISAKALPRLPSCADSTAMVHSVEGNKRIKVWLGMMSRVRSSHSARHGRDPAGAIGVLYNG